MHVQLCVLESPENAGCPFKPTPVHGVASLLFRPIEFPRRWAQKGREADEVQNHPVQPLRKGEGWGLGGVGGGEGGEGWGGLVGSGGGWWGGVGEGWGPGSQGSTLLGPLHVDWQRQVRPSCLSLNWSSGKVCKVHELRE